MPDHTITEHNYETGEEITRELTPEEIAQLVVITEATDETPIAD